MPTEEFFLRVREVVIGGGDCGNASGEGLDRGDNVAVVIAIAHRKLIDWIDGSSDGVARGVGWKTGEDETILVKGDGFERVGLQQTGGAEKAHLSLGNVEGRKAEEAQVASDIRDGPKEGALAFDAHAVGKASNGGRGRRFQKIKKVGLGWGDAKTSTGVPDDREGGIRGGGVGEVKGDGRMEIDNEGRRGNRDTRNAEANWVGRGGAARRMGCRRAAAAWGRRRGDAVGARTGMATRWGARFGAAREVNGSRGNRRRRAGNGVGSELGR
jgi:hypothetical protein